MMTKKITKISPQKNPNRVSLYSDDDFVIGVDKDLLLEYGLTNGVELTTELIGKLKAADNDKKCLAKAYHFLSFRPRSEAEMRLKLSEKYTPPIVEKTIKKLKKYNLINDLEFAESWVRDRGKSRGPILLKAELTKRGLDREIIDMTLGKIERSSIIESARTLITSRRKFQVLDPKDRFKKIAPYLMRRGYDYDTIKEALRDN